MNRRRKNRSNKTKRKSKQRGRKSRRMANFMGALLLEVCGMVLLLTLFFTFRESPVEYKTRITEPEKAHVELIQPKEIQPKEQFKSYIVGLFENTNRSR